MSNSWIVSPICQVEMWGVLIVCVKFGVICTSGKFWVGGLDTVTKAELPKEFWGTNGFFYMCGVSWGWNFLLLGPMICQKQKKTEHGQLNFRKKD